LALDPSNNPYIVWSECIDVYSDHYDIYFKKSADGGNTWSATKRLTWNSGWSDYPRILLDSNGYVHVIWSQFDTSSDADLYYKKSTNGGTTWLASQRLNSDPGYSTDAIMAVDSNDHIHVVWNDEKTGNYEIYYIKSINSGNSWRAIKRLTWTSGHSFYPYIAVDPGDNLHVVWEDDTKGNYEIFYKKSTNGGTSWSTKRLTFNSGNSYQPNIAFGSTNNPQIIWSDYSFGMCQVIYKQSTNGGTTWTGTKRLTWTPNHSFSGTLDVDASNHPHVIFRTDVSGNYEIYYRVKK
jgi:uncharacterized protein (DUF2147 family)